MALLLVGTVAAFYALLTGCRFYDLILLLNPPAYELSLLDKMVFLPDLPVVGLFAAPLLVALGLLIFPRRYFHKK